MASSALTVYAIRGLEDPNEGQDGEGEGGPVNEAAGNCGQVKLLRGDDFDVRGGALVIKDCPQGPGNNKGARKVTIDRGKCIRGSSSLQEEAKGY